MVPARSDKVSRVSSYSGYRLVISSFAYGTFTVYGWLSQNHSTKFDESIMRSEPRNARIPVWPLSRSLAATKGISFDFFSSGYLDVSVHRVVFLSDGGIPPVGLPHSDIHGSVPACGSPCLFAAYRVLLRL